MFGSRSKKWVKLSRVDVMIEGRVENEGGVRIPGVAHLGHVTTVLQIAADPADFP